MLKRYFLPTVSLVFFIGLTAFKPPKNTFPKNDILYSKYGGDVNKMMEGERKIDSLAHPYLYETKAEKKADTLSYDDESVILEKAEIMPQFPEGEKGLKEYIASSTAFMVDTLVGIKATVVVKFYVSSLGDAKKPVIIKTDNLSFELQTYTLIDGMPKWTPGRQNGKDINCYVTLTIKYGQ